MTRAELEQYVKDRIYPNNMGDITAEVLQDTLLAIVAGLVSNAEMSNAIKSAINTAMTSVPIVNNGDSAEMRGTSNTATGNSSLLVATNVETNADFSIICGAGHKIMDNNRVAVFGTNNTVENSSSNTIVAGNSNSLNGSSNTIVAGTGNTTDTDSDRSIIAGKDNIVKGANCIVAGEGNTTNANGAILAGKGAKATGDTFLAIGQGTGTNLFEVRTTGVYFKGQKIA